MNILSLLADPYINEIIRKLNICESNIIRTRNQFIRSTSSCRVWQLKYSVIYYYFMNFGLDDTRINEMCNIISLFINNSDIKNSLSRIIHFNHAAADNIIPINSYDIITNNGSETQNYYMCIYNTILGTGSILHFFTIIRVGDNYYLNSSYGSDFVCVPQYTTELDMAEFYGFCESLMNKTNTENINYFFQKYFLKGNMQRRYNNNTTDEIPSLKSKWMDVDKGAQSEIDYYLVPTNNYSVGLLHSYNELSNELIHSFIENPSKRGGKRKNRKSKKKTNRFYKKKSNRFYKKKTNRFYKKKTNKRVSKK